MELLKGLWSFLLDWPLGTIVGILSIIVMAGSLTVIICIIGSSVLSAINSCFMSKQKGVGEVVNKKIRPRFREMQGAIDIPIGYLLTVKVGEKSGEVSVIKDFFDSLHEGDKVSLVYTYGRIYDGIIIKEINDL